MNVARRTLLKGAAVSGLSVAALSASGLSVASSMTASQRPAVALVSGHAAEAAFVLGARASQAQISVKRTDLSADYMQHLAAEFAKPTPQRIIGLVDDASATVILDMARAAGARIEWVGQHAADAKGSRHALVSAAATEGCAAKFGHQLSNCGAGFALREQRFGQDRLNLDVAVNAKRQDAADQWATTLGHVLATGATGNASTAPRISNQHLPLRGHFVSFSIETGRSQNA